MKDINTLTKKIMKAGEGNIGAITALTDIYRGFSNDKAFDGFLFKLDYLEISGPLIWLCYKDICNHDALTFVTELRYNRLQKDLAALHYSGYTVPDKKEI